MTRVNHEVSQEYLSWPCCKSVEHTGAHETAVGLRSCPPNSTTETDEQRSQIDGSAAERCAQRDPVTSELTIALAAGYVNGT